MSSRRNKPISVPGKVAGSLFFFIFLLVGAIFTTVMFKQVLAGESARNWPSVHGTLTQTQIAVDKNSNEPFTVLGGYDYTVLGQDYSGNRVQLNPPVFSSYRKAYLLMEQIIEATPLKITYNPDNPEEAILIHSRRWGLLMILFPMIFALIGLGGIITLWLRGGRGHGNKSISQKATKKIGGHWFFFIFFIAGAGFMLVFLLPAKSTMEAMNWPETSCEILFSELRSFQGDDGTTYKPDIFYSYSINGETHLSNQVQFMGGSSSGAESKRKRLRQYPEGSQKICYVDPKDPTRSLLIKGFTGLYFFALIPLLFMCIGGAGMVHSFKKSLGEDGGKSIRQPRWETQSQETEDHVTLKAGQPRWAAFLFLLIFALFWNGIIFALFVPDVIRGLKSGSGIFMGLFSVPFILVGIGVAIGAGVMFLKLFNPRAEITLTPGSASPGDTITLHWQLTGGLKPLEELTLTFFGQEKASYRRGTNTHHDTHKFSETILFNSNQRQEFRQGEVTHVLAETLMPTFDAGNNKIQWFVEVNGVIRQWPDLKMKYELILSPSESTL